MKKKTVLITGTSGFVGSHLKEYLSTKYRLLTPAHRELDLSNTGAVGRYFRSHRIDVVIHTALVGGSRDEEHRPGSLHDNLKMFFNILKNEQYFARCLYFGSGAELDKERDLHRVGEDELGKYIPDDEYGLFKYSCAQIAGNHKKLVDLRLFGLFGPGENYRLRFISNMMVRVLLGKPLEMYQDAVFDYVYIDDLMRITEHFISGDVPFRHYNIGTGTPVSLLTLAKKIMEITGSKRHLIVRHKGLNKEYTCNPARLHKELGGFTFTPLDTALRQLYDWYRTRKKTLTL